MQTDQDLVMERPQATVTQGAGVSTLKSILLHVVDDPSLDARLDAALSLARAASAHLSCIHVTPIQAYVAFDSFGGVFVMSDVMRKIDEQTAELQTRVEDKLRSEDVSWDYLELTGDVAASLVRHAALNDLVVVGRDRERADFAGSATILFGDLLQQSRSPLFIPGDEHAATDPTGPALIAWDGSSEAANAVRSSLGLLELASSVQILQLIDEAKKDQFPRTALTEYLSRHGIHAELSLIEAGVDVRDQEIVAATIVARARALEAAYIVMGGYSHSRIGEYVFGGVTRTLLNACPIALVIAH